MAASKKTRKSGKSGRKDSVGPARKAASLPDISIEEKRMGRNTLHAIWDDLQQAAEARAPLVTLGYEEFPLDDPTSGTHVVLPPYPPADPEITVTETRPGFETLAIIEEELLRTSPSAHDAPRGVPLEAPFDQAEVLELVTFVILDKSLSIAATDDEKREFIARRLWHRLPPGGIEAVRRIDMRLADETALLMRVWCAVPRIES